MSDKVEVYTRQSVLDRDAAVTIRVGTEVATLTAGEWTKMLSRLSRAPAPRDTVY